MSEQTVNSKSPARLIRHNGRGRQVLIYLGKQFRFFINENDWKVLPMAALIASLVGMVIHEKFFVNMEGGLIGAFALACTAIWNGAFNSIQAVCRERAIIKREHRSGMHVTSYVAAHMIYQLFLCTAQTAVTLYVLKLVGVKIPDKGFMTSWMMLDLGITMLLTTYAADMLGLFLSSIAHTTTAAMTLMPFVLIFQLVFSGGIIPLPEWGVELSNYTISTYAVKGLAAQSGYNELPMEAVWETVSKMRDDKIGGTVTLGEIMDLLDSPAVEKYRDAEVLKSYTVGEAAEILNAAEESLRLREKEIVSPTTVREILQRIQEDDGLKDLRSKELPGGISAEKLLDELLTSDKADAWLDREVGTTITLGQVLDFLQAEKIVQEYGNETLNEPVTLGQITDLLKNNTALQAQRDRTITLDITMGDIFDLFGEEKVQEMIQQKTAEASRKPEFDRTAENIADNWLMLGVFIVFFALLATIALELIDKDKR